MNYEEQVRAAWEWVEFGWSSSSVEACLIKLPAIGHGFMNVGFFKTSEEAWTAAWEFTEQRQREIADVEKEITNLIKDVAHLNNHRTRKPEPEAAVYSRILAREQAALAELKKGWKA
jgi:hypothetical protein